MLTKHIKQHWLLLIIAGVIVIVAIRFFLFIIMVIILVFVQGGTVGPGYSDSTVLHEWGGVRLEQWSESLGGQLSLYDNKNEYSPAYGIAKYMQKNEYIYIIMNSEKDENQTNNNEKNYYSLRIKKDGVSDDIFFDKIEEIPIYAKINYESCDIIWYMEFSQMSDEDQKIFRELKNSNFMLKKYM